MKLIFVLSSLQAQSDDDDVGPDDVNVAVEGGFMDEFFSEVSQKHNTFIF